MAMNSIQSDEALSLDETNESTGQTMPDILCRELRNSFIKRNGESVLSKLERQKSIETFELCKSLISERRWPNKVFHHVRWLVMFLASTGLALMFMLRASITVAIVKMVNHTAIDTEEHPFGDELIGGDGNSLEPLPDGEFVWSNFVQSFIINIYFVGYALPQIYLSHWAGKNGVTKPITISKIVTLVTMALIPSAVYFGWEWVAALRFIMGLGGAACFPIFFGMIDTWFPSYENTRAIAMLQFFIIGGTTSTPLITSYLCSYHWSWAFYGFCFIGAVWLLLWLIVVRNSPEECWLISQQELKIILSERAYKPSSDKNGLPSPSVPWKKLFSSRNFYILMTSFVIYDGTQTCFMNLMPTYMRVIMGMDMASIGLICSLVQSASLFAILWSSELLTFLVMKLKWSSYKARVLIYFIASAGAFITWIMPTFINGGETILFALNKSLNQALEIVMMGTIIDDWGHSGLSGTMFSVYNTIGCGLIPLFSCSIGLAFDMIGGTKAAWTWLYASFGCINLVGFGLFLLLGQTAPNSPTNLDSTKKTSLP